MNIKLNIIHPRYYLEDDRPSQTTKNSQYINNTSLFILVLKCLKDSISMLPIVCLSSYLFSYNRILITLKTYSKGVRGLSV